MLSPITRLPQRRGTTRQQGVVLFLALIVLVAMTLAGTALLRSVFTSNKVAGNLAFQQAATLSADVGIERAIAWLETNNTGTRLYNNIERSGTEPVGYISAQAGPASDQSWEAYWQASVASSAFVNTLAADSAGNTVSYVIHRLCRTNGAPESGAGCATSPVNTGSQGNTRGSGGPQYIGPSQRYYRITARVEGPRRTVSFVQTVVAM